MYARQLSMELRPDSRAEVTRLLSKLVEGTPQVKSCKVANSTFHKIAATQEAGW